MVHSVQCKSSGLNSCKLTTGVILPTVTSLSLSLRGCTQSVINYSHLCWIYVKQRHLYGLMLMTWLLVAVWLGSTGKGRWGLMLSHAADNWTADYRRYEGQIGQIQSRASLTCAALAQNSITLRSCLIPLYVAKLICARVGKGRNTREACSLYPLFFCDICLLAFWIKCTAVESDCR
jgi:hypothetical protein